MPFLVEPPACRFPQRLLATESILSIPLAAFFDLDMPDADAEGSAAFRVTLFGEVAQGEGWSNTISNSAYVL